MRVPAGHRFPDAIVVAFALMALAHQLAALITFIPILMFMVVCHKTNWPTLLNPSSLNCRHCPTLPAPPQHLWRLLFAPQGSGLC